MSDETGLDAIDLDLLSEINQNPGQPLSSATRALEDRRATRTLYDRLFALEAQQFVSVDRSEKNYARATILPKGKEAIKGRIDPAPQTEARSP